MATNDLLQKISAAVAEYRRLNPGSTRLPAELALAVEASFEINHLSSGYIADAEIVDAEILTDEEAAAYDERMATKFSYPASSRHFGGFDRQYFTLPTQPAQDGPFLSRVTVEGQMAQRNGIFVNAMA